MSQTKINTRSPLLDLASTETESSLQQSTIKDNVKPIVDNLRSQQGIWQRGKTALHISATAGDAEREITDLEKASQVLLAKSGIDLSTQILQKAMYIHAGVQLQQQNEKLLAQEEDGLKRTQEIYAEGINRHATSYRQQQAEIDNMARNGHLNQDQWNRQHARLEAMNRLVEARMDTAAVATLTDSAETFNRARRKLND